MWAFWVRQINVDPLFEPFEEHQVGDINVHGIELNSDVKNIEEIRREVGMVFQHFNLFPHLTILENCTLAPIWVRQMPKKDAEEIAMKYLETVRFQNKPINTPVNFQVVSSSVWPSPAPCACSRN